MNTKQEYTEYKPTRHIGQLREIVGDNAQQEVKPTPKKSCCKCGKQAEWKDDHWVYSCSCIQD